MAMVGVASGSRLTARVVWPGLRVGGRLAPFHIHHMNKTFAKVFRAVDFSRLYAVDVKML